MGGNSAKGRRGEGECLFGGQYCHWMVPIDDLCVSRSDKSPFFPAAENHILESCTPEFMAFLDWLGKPVELQGWKGYRAGLDVIGKGAMCLVADDQQQVNQAGRCMLGCNHAYTHTLRQVLGNGYYACIFAHPYYLLTIGDTTGETSVYTNWNGYEIMYHCAPLMPFNPKDHHQVERRRFIGNDIVSAAPSSMEHCRTVS
jgi:hypothetical protein